MKVVQKFITRNYTPGRHWSDGSQITNLVIHTYGGAGTSLQGWFQKNDRGVSSHYAIRKDGIVEQYVRDQDTAHANGHGWYNAHSLSAEFQDDNNPNDSVRTEALYEAGSRWIFEKCLEYNIPINRQRIKTHREVLAEIGGTRDCPGGLNIDRLINGAKQYMDKFNELQKLIAERDEALSNTQKSLSDASKTIADLRTAHTVDTITIVGLTDRVQMLEKTNLKLQSTVEELTKEETEHENPFNKLLTKLYERLFSKSK